MEKESKLRIVWKFILDTWFIVFIYGTLIFMVIGYLLGWPMSDVMKLIPSESSVRKHSEF